MYGVESHLKKKASNKVQQRRVHVSYTAFAQKKENLKLAANRPFFFKGFIFFFKETAGWQNEASKNSLRLITTERYYFIII